MSYYTKTWHIFIRISPLRSS